MDNEELLNVKAKIEFDKMSARQNDLEEFHKLGSKDIGFKDILLLIAPFAFLLIANSFFEIDSGLLQVLCVVFFASSFVQGMVAAESRKTNRRIDLLLQIIKQERSKNM